MQAAAKIVFLLSKSDFFSENFTQSEIITAVSAETKLNKKVSPLTPVMSVICARILRLYALIGSVPHGYARKPVDFMYS